MTDNIKTVRAYIGGGDHERARIGTANALAALSALVAEVARLREEWDKIRSLYAGMTEEELHATGMTLPELVQSSRSAIAKQRDEAQKEVARLGEELRLDREALTNAHRLLAQAAISLAACGQPNLSAECSAHAPVPALVEERETLRNRIATMTSDEEAYRENERDRRELDDRSRPDDLRLQGWAVAAHNDYRLDGRDNTFWLLTKDGRCIKGVGRTDTAALDDCRFQIDMLPLAPPAPAETHTDAPATVPAASMLATPDARRGYAQPVSTLDSAYSKPPAAPKPEMMRNGSCPEHGDGYYRDGDVCSCIPVPAPPPANAAAGEKDHWICPGCVARVGVDEDGCCNTCGATCGEESKLRHLLDDGPRERVEACKRLATALEAEHDDTLLRAHTVAKRLRAAMGKAPK